MAWKKALDGTKKQVSASKGWPVCPNQSSGWEMRETWAVGGDRQRGLHKGVCTVPRALEGLRQRTNRTDIAAQKCRPYRIKNELRWKQGRSRDALGDCWNPGRDRGVCSSRNGAKGPISDVFRSWILRSLWVIGSVRRARRSTWAGRQPRRG